VLRETMNAVEERLVPSRFVRIHRSASVNIDRIKELQPWFRGDLQAILHDGTKLTMTKNRRKKLHAQLLLGSFHPVKERAARPGLRCVPRWCSALSGIRGGRKDAG
jgi:hypothetical protein